MQHGCLFLGASFSREDTFSAAAAALHTNYCHLQSICWNCCAYLRFKAITSLLLNATKWPLILKLCGWLTVFQFLQCRYWGFCSSSFFKFKRSQVLSPWNDPLTLRSCRCSWLQRGAIRSYWAYLYSWRLHFYMEKLRSYPVRVYLLRISCVLISSVLITPAN